MTIRSELEARIITWADAQSPKIPVALENVSFTKPTIGGYLETFFLASVTVNPDVEASRERETGILQVNCCVPQGNGTKAANELVAAIITLFPVLPKTGTVSIEHPPQKSNGLPRDDGFWIVPISISYRQER